MAAEITRSEGLTLPSSGIVVGDGYTGFTEELDAIVRKSAEILRDAYGMDVTIRFNSNRKSGGAWLVTSEEDGVGRNADIGITTSFFVVAELEKHIKKVGLGSLKNILEQDDIDPKNPPESYLVISSHIGNAALADPSVANFRADEPERSYAHVNAKSPEDALNYLLKNAVVPTLSRSPGM